MPDNVRIEEDLKQLCESTKKTYDVLLSVDEGDFPPERRKEYWRDRNVARMAWEQAENAAFANLVEEQKRKLPAIAASNANLARDVQAAANALAMLDLISTSLGILEEGITLLKPVVP